MPYPPWIFDLYIVELYINDKYTDNDFIRTERQFPDNVYH